MTSPRRPDHPDVDALWRDLHDPLLGFIARRVPDLATAEDILQEVMLRIHRHAGDQPRAQAVGAWVHQIARNAITDHYRRAVVRRERPTNSHTELDRPTAATLDPDPAELREELAACLAPMLARLPPTDREALTLTDLDGHPQTTAATQLGLSVSGMKSRVQRARTRLRALLVQCCEIELDRRGGPIDYHPRGGSCDCSTPPSARSRSNGQFRPPAQ